MLVLFALIYLPFKVILVFSLFAIFGNNTFDNIHFDKNPIWKVLHAGGKFKLENTTILVGYPFIHWNSVMALGYCFGSFYRKFSEYFDRVKILNSLG
jgi:uncharacterized membrane protein